MWCTNPTHDYLIVNTNSTENNAHLSIVDFTGKVYLQKQVKNGINKLLINKLPSGMYQVVIFSSEGNKKAIPFIIAR